MEIKYFVRTTCESHFDYNLDYIEIFDENNQYIQSYINALIQINDYDSVLLEDDCVLCKNFKKEIEKVINQYSNNIINFFSFPSQYYTSHFTTKFNYNQCTYFPKGTSKFIAIELQKFYDKNPKIKSYGAALGYVLKNLGIPHYIYRPSLVQHIDYRMKIRNTIYFKDYLDELGITMEQAFDNENQNKLKKLLEEDRKKWHGEID